MATYGYAGDFSSDDDEKLELSPAKYDNSLKPSRPQIEEAIESIKRLPFDQEISLTDEILAGLLDYYQTQRGPIVDSTRKLYNKIALRLVRGDQSKINDGMTTNGSNNVNANNNNNNILPGKGAGDAFSSDDDDFETAAKPINNPKKFDSSVVYNNNVVDVDDNDEDKMDVDSETPSAAARNTKPIELGTSDDDSSTAGDENLSEDGSTSSENDLVEGSSAESDLLEVTPIRVPASATREKEAVETLMNMRPSTPKQVELSTKRQPLAHSTPKESFGEQAKKPYTRSQRVTTRSATKGSRDLKGVTSRNTSSSSADAFIEKKPRSRSSYTLTTATVLIVLLAFLVYYFRSNILQTAEPLFRKKITF